MRLALSLWSFCITDTNFVSSWLLFVAIIYQRFSILFQVTIETKRISSARNIQYKELFTLQLMQSLLVHRAVLCVAIYVEMQIKR